ncbi:MULTISPECIES: hypothetical protein [Rhizobium]|uniref:Uncharacterized protein n=1 Tax=Rhizobium johnstonii (strain DSM 114642 / LMG 32736 / 3841) TaxID=216596 RepID=Q1MHA9_RHIJ3|nr:MULTISPECIES: hypothetical protein [Rhizobium]NEI92363.1 hypothetical protein [Rhizobium leguminosarum]NEJ79119.1 hypothetical protein [Rhizobium leguminosarum]CAK07656.1 hypothetical protein RL2164 [Rhizobium johnstonii 3841]
MYQIAINRVAGGLRLLRSLIDMGDVAILRGVFHRNEAYIERHATETERLVLASVRKIMDSMIEEERNLGVGACLNLSHPSVAEAYQRPVKRIVDIVDARGGLKLQGG